MLALVAALAVFAPAHAVGLSRGVYVVDGPRVAAELTFARPELLRLVPGLDVAGDGVDAADLAAAKPALAAALSSGVRAHRGAHACAVAVGGVDVVEEDGAVVALDVDCGLGAEDVVVDLVVVDALAAGHRHLGQVRVGALSHDVVAFAGHREFTLSGTAAAPPVVAYLGLGVEHIVFGFDHIVFLLGVIVVVLRAGTLRSLLAIVTAFTVAHSVTLAIAATSFWVPPSAPVEILIAVSIVAVGAEAIFAPSTQGRWTRTLFFGLIHGFGFAGALAEIGLPPAARLPALALFNVGVEAGQLAIVAVVAPVLLAVRARIAPERASRVVVGVGVAVAAAGAVWFAERVAGL